MRRPFTPLFVKALNNGLHSHIFEVGRFPSGGLAPVTAGEIPSAYGAYPFSALWDLTYTVRSPNLAADRGSLGRSVPPGPTYPGPRRAPLQGALRSASLCLIVPPFTGIP